ncbi:F-box/LRR-repeat protein, partial [Trifolium pratense]
MENSAAIDRISNLPDEILCYILSFLPTKLAFTTTILSKRWTSLFKLLTTLHFDDESFSKQAFPCFVNTVMLFTQLIKSQNISPQL